MLVRSFGRIRNVFGTCVGCCCNRYGTRHLCFVIYFTLILSFSHMAASFLTHWFNRSLACFLFSVTRLVANLFTTFFSPSLPPSFTNSLVCLLSPSFLPFNSMLDFRWILTFLTHSLTHSHTRLLSCFSTSWLIMSLAYSRFFLFSLACSLSDSLSH